MPSQALSKPILVIAESSPSGDGRELSEASAHLVRLARTLTSAPVHVLAASGELAVGALVDAGADIVYLPSALGYSCQVPAAVADAAREVLVREDFGAVLLTSDYLGRAVTGMLGVISSAGAAVDVVSVMVEGETLLAEKSALGGSWTTAFRATQGFPILALRPGVGPKTGSAGAGEVIQLEVALSRGARKVEVCDSQADPRGSRVSLTDADVVVVGGRGAESDFALVEDFADALGAAVGATRVVCDEGLAPRSAQIGQTGVTVAPDLYIGLGVSGAVHHTCGMRGSETIVAVVDDPDAPILELADFAVVGDVAEVVPQALASLAARS